MRRLPLPLVWLCLLTAACTQGPCATPSTQTDAGAAAQDAATSVGDASVVVLDAAVAPDAAALDAGPQDAAVPGDAAVTMDAALPQGDGGTRCVTQEVTGGGVLQPVPGELFYVQVGLGGISLGEGALVVGPDGTRVFVDVGNNAHDDDLVTVLDETTTAMAAAGFSDSTARTVDAVILTHHHADHVDGLADLLGQVTVRQHIIHRGLVDITNAANDATVEGLCTVLAANTALDTPLCTGAATAPCNAAQWSGTYPSNGCPGLSTATLALGAARVEFLAADATVGTDRYESLMGPLLMDDVNGENARSVTGLLTLGSFQLVFAGDLTGGGSDTDPVEAFVAARLPAHIRNVGVDIMHASHHGRETSSSAAWLDVLLPRDGRDRHVVMGVSTAHVGSPHAAVVAALVDGRLSDGAIYTTRVALGGTSGNGVVDAQGGTIRVRTENGGAGYLLQAVTSSGTVVRTVRAHSVRSCTP